MGNGAKVTLVALLVVMVVLLAKFVSTAGDTSGKEGAGEKVGAVVPAAGTGAAASEGAAQASRRIVSTDPGNAPSRGTPATNRGAANLGVGGSAAESRPSNASGGTGSSNPSPTGVGTRTPSHRLDSPSPNSGGSSRRRTPESLVNLTPLVGPASGNSGTASGSGNSGTPDAYRYNENGRPDSASDETVVGVGSVTKKDAGIAGTGVSGGAGSSPIVRTDLERNSSHSPLPISNLVPGQPPESIESAEARKAAEEKRASEEFASRAQPTDRVPGGGDGDPVRPKLADAPDRPSDPKNPESGISSGFKRFEPSGTDDGSEGTPKSSVGSSTLPDSSKGTPSPDPKKRALPNGGKLLAVHTIADRESYWALAERYYKNGTLYPIIESANQGLKFVPGKEVLIPELDPAEIAKLKLPKKTESSGKTATEKASEKSAPGTPIVKDARPAPVTRETSGTTKTSRAAQSQRYKVQKGDTLSALAKRFYGDISKIYLIEDANSDVKFLGLIAGTEIVIPVEK
jgi:nucleoid-associated protein YgaU